jgi:integrase
MPYLLKKFESLYGERPFDSMEADEIYHFLETLTQDHAKSSRRLRYAQLKAFYNFIITRCSLDMKNPCNAPLLSKAFKTPKPVARRILDREEVEELIYKANHSVFVTNIGVKRRLRLHKNAGIVRLC